MTLRDQAMIHYRLLIGQQEAMLVDFLVSGAMLRDLWVEKGPMEWVEVEPFKLVLQQDFRVV